MKVSFSKIKNLAGCPIDWPTITNMEPWYVAALYWEWDWLYTTEGATETDRFFVSQVVKELIDGSSPFLDEYESEGPDEHKHIYDVLTERVPRACEKYENTIGRLSNLRFLSSLDYNGGKHSTGGLVGDKLISATAGNGASRFISELDEDHLRELFWHWFENAFQPSQLDCQTLWPGMGYESDNPDNETSPEATKMWADLRTAANMRVALNALTTVGASEGTLTSYVAIELSLSSQTVHAFPITREKAEQTNRTDWLFSTDVLQGVFIEPK